MRLVDCLKRWLGFPRSVEEVAAELADGLRDGSIYLDHLGPEGDTVPEPDSGDSESVAAPANGVNGTHIVPPVAPLPSGNPGE